MINDYGGDTSVQDFRRRSRDDKNWDEEEYRSPYLAGDGLAGSERDNDRGDGTDDDEEEEEEDDEEEEEEEGGEGEEEDEFESDIERAVHSRLASDSFLSARSTSEMFDERSLSSTSPDEEEEEEEDHDDHDDDHDSHHRRRRRGSLGANSKRLGGRLRTCLFVT